MFDMVSMDQAMQLIQSGMRVYAQGTAATPRSLLQAFTRRGPQLSDVTLVHMHLEGPAPWVEGECLGHVHDVSLFVGPNLRAAMRDGTASYIPLFLSDVPWYLSQPETRPQVALINVSPPDRHGFVSLGPSIDASLTAIEQADIVIAQVNPQVPRVLGDACIPMDRITVGVAVDEPLSVLPERPVDQAVVAIGRLVAELVPDRACLQIGIGRVPDAVLSSLQDHRDLGVHSEMMSDGVRRLAAKGVITGRYKVTDPGKIVASFALGSRELYDFVADNPVISLHGVDYTNDTAVIRQNPRMVSVNSAVEVDITGQVAAEAIGPYVVSGVGGQMDFVRGASLSPGGRSIIALPARTGRGEPRVVAALRRGAAVTTTRNHVQYVVTEYGAAELKGATIEERARRMIAIAHPEDRERLWREARELVPGL